VKVEWDVKIEKSRKSGLKSNASNKDMLEQERLVSEMAEKFSSDWFRNVQIGLDLSKLAQK
jgi:hypothetical protein